MGARGSGQAMQLHVPGTSPEGIWTAPRRLRPKPRLISRNPAEFGFLHRGLPLFVSVSYTLLCLRVARSKVVRLADRYHTAHILRLAQSLAHGLNQRCGSSDQPRTVLAPPKRLNANTAWKPSETRSTRASSRRLSEQHRPLESYASSLSSHPPPRRSNSSRVYTVTFEPQSKPVGCCIPSAAAPTHMKLEESLRLSPAPFA